MKIINRANGRETSVGAAVQVTCEGETGLRDMVTRLIEELCFNASGTQVLNAMSLSRILEYGFRVED